MQRAIEAIEFNVIPVVTVRGEPQLGKRGLYPTLSTKGSTPAVRVMMNLLSYSDGEHSLLDIADLIDQPIWELRPLVDQLAYHQLVELRPVA